MTTRILLVEGSGRGFLSHYAHALALGLAERGACVRLVTGRRDELADWPVPIDKSPCLHPGWRGWAALRRHVRSFCPDMVHFQWIADPLRAALFCAWLRHRGIATIYTPHNILPHRRRWASQPAFGLLYRSVDRILARDRHIAWGLEELLGVGDNRIAAMPGSPNLLAHPNAPYRRPCDLPPKPAGRLELLFFGHGAPRKGLGMLLRRIMRPDWPAIWHPVIAGEEVLAAGGTAGLKALADSTAVTVLDRYVAPAEVRCLFSRADLLLMPYEKLCTSPLLDLAAALSLPVLRTDRVQGNGFIDGLHGRTVPAGDADALIAALEALTPGVLAAMRRRLARHVDLCTAMHRLAAAHLHLYAQIDPKIDRRAVSEDPQPCPLSAPWC